jgi:hypothetical protein
MSYEHSQVLYLLHMRNDVRRKLEFWSFTKPNVVDPSHDIHNASWDTLNMQLVLNIPHELCSQTLYTLQHLNFCL